MNRLHFFAFIVLCANIHLYGASWIEQVKRAPSADATHFITAKNAIHHNNPGLFIDTLNSRPSLVHHKVQSGITAGAHEDLLTTAIGNLRNDRSFFFAQLLHRGAVMSSRHISCCIAALQIRPERFNDPLEFFCIEPCVLNNLQKLFHTMSAQVLTDTQVPAQDALKDAIRNFIGTHGKAIYNIPDLLAALGVHPIAGSSSC